MTEHDLEFYRGIAKQRDDMRNMLREVLATIPPSQDMDGGSFADLTLEQIDRMSALAAS